MPRSIIRTITTAIAIAALAAPTALARPDSMPPTAAKAKQSQNARSADTATASAASEYPTRPGQGEQAIPRPETTTTATTKAPAERDIAWTPIGHRHRRRPARHRRHRWHRQPHPPQRARPHHRVATLALG